MNLAFLFISLLVTDLKVRTQVANYAFKDAKTRLLEFIKELSEEHGFINAVTKDTVINHPYTQKEIATLIGLSRPTLNILINELQQEKIIVFERKQIILLKK